MSNKQTIIDKARLLLGIQFTARSFSDLDSVYCHEKVIKSTDFLILEISKKDEQIAELERQLSSSVAGLFSEKELAERDLEQQVKSLSEFAESLLFRGCLENTFERNDVLERIKEIKGGAE